MNRGLLFAALVTLVAGLTTMAAPQPAQALGCEDQICEGNNDCRYLKNAICLNGMWFPCEWDLCLE